MTRRWKVKGEGDEAGEIKDGSKRGRHRRKRTQKWHETFCLFTAQTCSPCGCGTTAACRLDRTY